jgi:hypothetical protein
MAPGHWQIIKHDAAYISERKTEALSIGEAPNTVIDTAVRAATLIGDGFYGVDLKQRAEVGIPASVRMSRRGTRVSSGRLSAARVHAYGRGTAMLEKRPRT